MRQRLGIARCLLSDPALLILDEPMNGLDPAGILEMRGLIRDFVDEGRTVFLSSHLLDEVERTCDQVAIIDRGEVVIQGTIADIATAQEQVRRDRLRPARGGGAAAARAHGAVASSARRGRRAARQARLRRACRAPRGGTQPAAGRGGLEVHRLEPSRVSLEERFLEITSRLGART